MATLKVGDVVETINDRTWFDSVYVDRNTTCKVFKNKGSDRYRYPFVVYVDDKPNAWRRRTFSSEQLEEGSYRQVFRVAERTLVIEDWRL